jgi:hypothetical protein
MTVVDVLVSLIVLVPMGAIGVAFLWRARLGLDPLEWVAYGVPLGWVGSSLALYGLCLLQGSITTLLVLSLLVLLTVLTVVLIVDGQPVARCLTPDAPSVHVRGPIRGAVGIVAGPVPVLGNRRAPARSLGGALGGLGELRPLDLILSLRRPPISWLPVLTIGGLAVVWAVFWSRMITYGPDELTVGHLWFWTDGALHMGDIAGLVYGDNFPVQNLRLEGNIYGYHLLTTVTSAALVKVGLTPFAAICAASWLGWVWVAVALYAFARRVLRQTVPAVLAMLLFVLGGNLSWLLTIRQFNGTGDLVDTLHNHAYIWSGVLQDIFGYSNFNFYWVFFLAQRSYLYGLPMFLLILALLLVGLRTGQRRAFIVAGVVAGTSPLASLPVLLALAMILPFLALLSPTGRNWRRPWTCYPVVNWLLFAVAATVTTLPLLLYQYQSDSGGFEVRWEPDWILQGSGQPLWWYWLKATGALGLFVAIGLFLRRGMPPRARVLLWSSIPLVVIVSGWVFQPWSPDNHKLFAFGFVGLTVGAAAVIAELWRRGDSPVIRVTITILAVSLILTGLLTNLSAVASPQSWNLAGRSAVAVGEWARDDTPPHAVFATAQRHNAPVTMIGGRRVIVGFGGWMSTRGYDVADQERALRSIMAYDQDAERYIDEYQVGYVVIGPPERDDFDPNADAYLSRYPVAYEQDDYVVFAVSPETIDLALANGATLPEDPATGPSATPAPVGVVAGS